MKRNHTGPKPIIGVRLDPEVDKWLRRSAAVSKRSITDIVRDLVHAGYERRHKS